MGNTWIVDIVHFLDEDGGMSAELPTPARKLAEHFTAIISMVSHPEPVAPSEYQVKCRRRPQRKACSGMIEADLDPETENIVWWCPVCEDRGVISNWKGSLWDLRGAERFH